MYVTRQQDVDPEEAGDAPLFYGGRVTRQPLVGKTDQEDYNFGIVSFYDGSKNHFHTHTSDQILFATKGVGIVANESEEVQMEAGDTAFIPAGEKHWHGAADGHDFSHISLTRPDSVTEMFKPEA
ncbi:MAG: hypothetical protein CL739_01670 [Chloroflexi bacterium]|nr:hypothetical protein [Chloroflexota bacterium]MED6295828.1 cupin domain-containing protein [Chloroflexota bacterium]|tara:strand:+ start:593 stop:967 length:375 start_codon:yes stop_codon:yes gene_type:complete